MTQTEQAESGQSSTKRRLLIAALCFISAALLANIISIWQFDDDIDQISSPLSELIGSQLADAAAPLILSDNQISLQALAHKAARHKTIAHTAFYNIHNELLAQSGRSSMAGQGLQVRTEISLQDRLLGYSRISLTPPSSSLTTRMLTLLSSVLGLLGLGSLIQSLWSANPESDKPKSALLEKQVEERYQQLPEPDGEYGIIAVELLQLPLMRKQLSGDTLYEYLTTFEHWLEQVADLYGATIRVGETGFTLSLHDHSGQLDLEQASSALMERSCSCAYALMKTLNSANLQRSAISEPVYESRIGVHISAPLETEARLLRELYAQDAHRQAWLACSGKASGTVSLSHSVVTHEHFDHVQVGPQDANGFYELVSLNSNLLMEVNQKVQSIS